MQRLDVWWDGGALRGIQVTYPDNTVTQVFDSPSGSTNHIIFEPGERVTSMTLWGNGIGTRSERIRITTTKQTFDVGKDTSGQTAYDAPIGSGILVGMFGRSGADIDQLGPVFLDGAVQSINIGNINYTPTLDKTSKGISSVVLAQTYFSNQSGGNPTWNFANGVSRTDTTRFTQTTATMYGASVSVTVSAELFGIGGDTTAGFEWQKTDTQETTTETSQEVELSWSLSGTLAPGEGVTAIATCEQGIGNATYTSTVTILLADGSVSQFSENGTFSNVVYTKATATMISDVNGKPGLPFEGPHDGKTVPSGY